MQHEYDEYHNQDGYPGYEFPPSGLELAIAADGDVGCGGTGGAATVLCACATVTGVRAAGAVGGGGEKVAVRAVLL